MRYAGYLRRHLESPVQVVRDDDVVVGNHTFHGGDDYLAREAALDLVERLLNVGRRDSQDHNVGIGDYLVDVRREIDARHVEFGCREITGVLAFRLELLYHFRSADEPVDLSLCRQRQLRQCRCPAAAT